MSGYAYVKETIFTGATGRALRHHPPEVREVQFLLCAGPGRDPFGIFIFDPGIAAHVLGRAESVILGCVDVLCGLEFCRYDPPSMWVWVIEMAHHQFTTPLKAVDNRCALARKWYAALPRNPFLGPWFDRYATDFHLEKDPYAVDRREGAGGGAPKPLVLRAPVPEGVIGGSGGKEGEPTVELGDSELPDPQETRPIPAAELDTAFERIWSAYPNAVEKKDARAMFARLKPTPQLVTVMLDAIAEQKLSRKWREGFIPKIANWFEKHCWKDRLETDTPVLSPRTSKAVDAGERWARRSKP